MKLEKLTLANFRGFDQIDIEFASDLTLLAGVNGVGKSGVLTALRSALSVALPRFTVSGEPPLSLSERDIKLGKSSLSLSVALRLDLARVIVDIRRAAQLPSDRAESLIGRRDELRFATRQTKKGSAEEKGINDEIRRIDFQLEVPSDAPTVLIAPHDVTMEPDALAAVAKSDSRQPLAVFYSTARFLSRLPPVLPKTRSTDPATAYDKALSQLEVSLNDFANWYRVLSSEAPVETRDRLLQQLDRAVGDLLPGVSGLTLHDGRPPGFSVNKGGDALFLDQLSDGERGLLALVFDLTRRLATANPLVANPIAEGAALVLIDEIEMHLHPQWQRDVMKRLPATFKHCQFVITTHSPQVIGEVEARCVRLLSLLDGKVRVETPATALGADSNWILNVLMGTNEMDDEIERELDGVSLLIADRKLEEARERLLDLRVRFGNPDRIQALASLLERVDRLGR